MKKNNATKIGDLVSDIDLDTTFNQAIEFFIEEMPVSRAKKFTKENPLWEDKFNSIMDDPNLSRSFACFLMGHMANLIHGIPDNFNNN